MFFHGLLIAPVPPLPRGVPFTASTKKNLLESVETVTVHDSVLTVPSESVTLTVQVCGEPLADGLLHNILPVSEFMVIPEGAWVSS